MHFVLLELLVDGSLHCGKGNRWWAVAVSRRELLAWKPESPAVRPAVHICIPKHCLLALRSMHSDSIRLVFSIFLLTVSEFTELGSYPVKPVLELFCLGS